MVRHMRGAPFFSDRAKVCKKSCFTQKTPTFMPTIRYFLGSRCAGRRILAENDTFVALLQSPLKLQEYGRHRTTHPIAALPSTKRNL